MPIKDALYAIVVLLGLVTAPVVFCFYKEQLDILDAARKLLFKQRASAALISAVEFMALERAVLRKKRYYGKNRDVIDLLFPLRYWFNGLSIVVHLSAIVAVLALTSQVLSVTGKNATFNTLFLEDGKTVSVAVLVFACSLLVYFITLLMALTQKRALKRRISELVEELP